MEPPDASPVEIDESQSESMKALDEAIQIAGGVGVLAQRIGAAASAPSMWKKRRSVPAEYCPAIERETGVRCERLRANVPWDVLRMQASEQSVPSSPAPATAGDAA